MTSKELAVIPPNADLVEEYGGTKARIGNGIMMAVAGIPATGFYGMAWDGSMGNMIVPVGMGWMLLMVVFAVSPLGGKGIAEIDAPTFKNFFKLKLSQMPFVGKLVHDSTEWTKIDYSGLEEDQKRLTVVHKGKVSVYNLTTVDPKDIWDRMYKEETGEAIEKSIAYNKTMKKLLSEKITANQNSPEVNKSQSFLRNFLGQK